jgi:DNA mismatch endonuclease (patch repair protein)
MARSKSNVDFWESKIARNIARDLKNIQELGSSGWQVHIIWECEVKTGAWIPETIAFLSEDSTSNDIEN